MGIKGIFEQTILRGGVGDKVTFNGVRYVCKMANCVWSPAVYPQAWEEQVEA